MFQLVTSPVCTALALEHVFGYTIVKDVSGCDAQLTDNQIICGKGFEWQGHISVERWNRASVPIY